MYENFIRQEKPDYDVSKYGAGIVSKIGSNYTISYSQKGAEDTFSVGQPVYDEDGNLMGYMGITLFENLIYSYKIDGVERVPVACWAIMLPTEHCTIGKIVRTYWQLHSADGSIE